MTTLISRQREDPHTTPVGASFGPSSKGSAAPTHYEPLRSRLACEWEMATDGNLVCTWQQVPSNESRASHRRGLTQSGPPSQKPGRADVARSWIWIALLLAASAVVVLCFQPATGSLL
jgi:hypothetical protein